MKLVWLGMSNHSWPYHLPRAGLSVYVFVCSQIGLKPGNWEMLSSVEISWVRFQPITLKFDAKQSHNTFAGIGTEFDIHNPCNSFLIVGCFAAHNGPEDLQTILFTQSGKIWRASNRSFSEHRNESRFVFSSEETASPSTFK